MLGFAAYGASKAALNIFSKVIRLELAGWGVKVATIQPSAFRTSMQNLIVWHSPFGSEQSLKLVSMFQMLGGSCEINLTYHFIVFHFRYLWNQWRLESLSRGDPQPSIPWGEGGLRGSIHFLFPSLLHKDGRPLLWGPVSCAEGHVPRPVLCGSQSPLHPRTDGLAHPVPLPLLSHCHHWRNHSALL